MSDPLTQIVSAPMSRKATCNDAARRRRRSEKADRVNIPCRLRLDAQLRKNEAENAASPISRMGTSAEDGCRGV